MIIIDTNVISEMMKLSPARSVFNWFDQQDANHLFITTITIAEISYGLNTLPLGKRRTLLEEAFNNTIKEAFKHRILTFDNDAALAYGKIMSQRKELGQPLSVLDGQIIAIARTHNAKIATRNIKDFSDCGIFIINPFNLR